MENSNLKDRKGRRRFRLVDGLLILMTLLPLAGCLALQVMTKPASEGMDIAGARIYFTVPMPLMDMPITESQVNSWAVIASIFFLCLYLTHGLTRDAHTRRQLVAEWAVEKTKKLVAENMGPLFAGFAPFIGAVMALSAFSSLMSLLGLYPPTSDLNVVAGWAILVFILITHYKLKGGLWYYLKGFTQPVALLTPINIFSELATPLSMSFRHYGNVLSGTVIAAMIGAGLQGLSRALLGWLPGVLGEVPFLQIGLPAVMSVYFDVFSGCLQAFIFAMLTMLYIVGGFPREEWEKRQARKARKKKKAAA